MKQNKIYTLGSITYTFSLAQRAWNFKFGDNMTYLAHCHGNEKATKIASVINGSLKRSNGLDNLARANISRLIR